MGRKRASGLGTSILPRNAICLDLFSLDVAFAVTLKSRQWMDGNYIGEQSMSCLSGLGLTVLVLSSWMSGGKRKSKLLIIVGRAAQDSAGISLIENIDHFSLMSHVSRYLR